ncbi:hypothetical protein ACER0C_027661 [Sarotherodon galilaeus]
MCRINQAALLFIQLLVMCHVFAENHRSTFVFRGGSVTLTCNISNKNATQISWTNGRSVFQYSLTIFSAQPEDEGLYTCAITGKNGLHSITWNLTNVTLLYPAVHLLSLELHQPQGDTAHWKNNKRRSQYMENLNAIYDHF